MSSLSAWSLPSTLSPPLSGRDAVTDTVYRALLGLDTNDVDLFKSALTKDVTFIFDGQTTNGLDNLVHALFEKCAKLDTTHHLSNIRVNIDGAKATLTATILAQHYLGGTGTNPNAQRYLAGALYLVDLVREASDVEVWKIASWKLQKTWAEGDPSIVM